jgi:hypothetical protein
MDLDWARLVTIDRQSRGRQPNPICYHMGTASAAKYGPVTMGGQIQNGTLSVRVI